MALRIRKKLERRVGLQARRKALGRSPGRWDAWRRSEAAAVRARGRCEVGICREIRNLEAHHPFGRTGEPWASSRIVCILVCHDHHEEVTGRIGSGLNIELRDNLRRLALTRMRMDLRGRLSHTVTLMEDTLPLAGRFDYLRKVADLNGIAPPFWREKDSGGRSR